jgi:transcriptional regulator GlxA family with amidase domain
MSANFRGPLMPVAPTHGQSFRARLQEISGVAPHKYLYDLRVKQPKRVTLTTKLPLADIALIAISGIKVTSHAFSRAA